MGNEQRNDILKLSAAAVLFFAFWFLSERGMVSPWWLLIPYVLAGFETLKEAAENIIHGRFFDEEFLMAIASIGAIAAGEIHEACAVMLLFGLGELFEDIATDRTRDSIAKLMDIRSDAATVLRPLGENKNGSGEIVSYDGKRYVTESIDPKTICVGDLLLVKPGERVAVDGIVVEGSTSVDASALTGESMPVEKTIASPLLSGSINLTGVVKMRVEKTYEDSTVSKILELVENAEEQKTKTENFITKFSRIYTPCVCGAAVVLGLVVPFVLVMASHRIMPLSEPAAAISGLGFGTGIWRIWILRALGFLVVSCPCALVVSIPLAFVGGIGAASRQGILIKGSNYVELLAKADTLMLDKTGTLTEGFFTVQAIEPTGHCCFEKRAGVPHHDHKDCLLHLAAAVEAFSDHPAARSIVRAAAEHLEHEHECGGPCHHHVEHMQFACEADHFPEHCVIDVREEAGRGIRCIADGQECLVGNDKLMARYSILREAALIDLCSEAEQAGGTIVHVALGGKYMGFIAVGDTVKSEAAATLEELRSQGIRQIVMLTGDSPAAAAVAAEALGNNIQYQAGLLPADKVTAVEQAMGQGHVVAFAGDGINDAPVLTRADVGIAMGALGSDAAIESADIVLMDDKLSNLPKTLKIARRTLKIVRENIVLTLTIKALILALSAVGITTMWMDVFGDVGVLMLAVLNSTRTMRK